MPGLITTNHRAYVMGAAPSSVAAGQMVTYFKTDGNPYTKDEFGTELAILTDTVAVSDKELADNTANAWRVLEGANVYTGYTTLNGAEDLDIGFKAGVTTLKVVIEAGTRHLFLDSGGDIYLDAVGTLNLESSAGVINVGADDISQAINIGTDGDRTITVGIGDAATGVVIAAGTGDLALSSAGDLTVTIADNTALAYSLAEGARDYFVVVTTNASEAMSFGNATSNPTFSFLGSGQVDFAGAVDVNGAFTGTGTYSYSQTAGAFTYNVGGSNFDLTSVSRFQATAGGGAADAIKLLASAGGGFDFDAGTAGYALDSSGSIINTGPDNTAVMWQVQEGVNSYLKAVSTNGSELVEIGEDLATLKAAAITGLLSTQMGVASGTSLNVGGTAFVQDDLSAIVTNTTVETAFDKTHAFPAATLQTGRRLKIHAGGFFVDTNGGSQNCTIRLQLDDQTTVFTLLSDIISANDNDMWELEAEVIIFTSGAAATRTYMCFGGIMGGPVDTNSLLRGRNTNAANLDTTAIVDVQVTAQWAAANATNQVRMDFLTIDLI